MAFRPLIKRFLHYICYLSARVRVAGALYLISITLVLLFHLCYSIIGTVFRENRSE
jgi:hypothetical protein